MTHDTKYKDVKYRNIKIKNIEHCSRTPPPASCWILRLKSCSVYAHNVTTTSLSADGYKLPSGYLGEFGLEGAGEGDVARHLLSGVDPLYRLLIAAVQVHNPPSDRVVSHLETAESHVLTLTAFSSHKSKNLSTIICIYCKW